MADPVFDPSRPSEDVVPVAAGTPTFNPSRPSQDVTQAPPAQGMLGNIGQQFSQKTAQLGAGIEEGVVGVAGLPGDIREGAISGIESLTGTKVPQWAHQLPFLKGPTSKQLQASVQQLTGEPPKSTDIFDEVSRTAGAFIPAMFGGEGTIVKKLGQVLFPALFSEAAGQATRQVAPDAEPLARAAASVTPATVSMLWRTAPERMEKATADAFQAARNDYQHPDVKNLQIKTASAQQAAMEIANDMLEAGFNPATSPGTTAALTHMMFQPQENILLGTSKKQGPKPFVTVDDMQAVRTQLSDVAGKFSEPIDQKWATLAHNKVDEWMARLKSTDLIRGDAQKASARLDSARGNYWAGKSLEYLGQKLYAAELRSGSTYSGQNFQNVLRQSMRSILMNPKSAARYTPKEKDLMEKIVMGTAPENAMRTIAKALPRTGVLGTMLHGAAYHFMGPAGLIAAPMIGETAASIESKFANKFVKDLQRTIVERSPMGEAGYKIEGKPMPDVVTPAVLGTTQPRVQRFDSQGNPTDETPPAGR